MVGSLKVFGVISEEIFLSGGRIGEVSFNNLMFTKISGKGLEYLKEPEKVIKKLQGIIECHPCVSIKNEHYEHLVVLTKQTNIKNMGEGLIEHSTQFISPYNMLGHFQNQYVVDKPIYLIRKDWTAIRETVKCSEFWDKYKFKIFEALKEKINDPEFIIELSEPIKNLMGG